NDGVAAWNDGTVRVQHGAKVINNGQFGAYCDRTMSSAFGGLFSNFGTFIKAASTGETTLQIALENEIDAVIEVSSGTLDFQRDGDQAGEFTVEEDAELVFSAGTQTLYAGSSFTGDGTVEVSGSGTLKVVQGILISTGVD